MKDYKGKLFSIYGDSLSTLQGYIPAPNAVYYCGEECELSGVKSYVDTWWGQVIEKLGGRLLKNNSWSGCFVTNPYNADVESCGCSEERLTSLCNGGVMPNVIIVFMGTNDRGYNLPIYGDDAESVTCFVGAYSHMIKRLKTLYPSAEIWCMTFRRQPIFSPDKGNCIDCHSQAVRDCAAKFGCKLVDLFNYPPYDVYDKYKIHASRQGMHDISSAVICEVNKF
jgi:hypothetical protein